MKWIREELRHMVHVNYFTKVRIRSDGWKQYWVSGCPSLRVRAPVTDLSKVDNIFKEIVAQRAAGGELKDAAGLLPLAVLNPDGTLNVLEIVKRATRRKDKPFSKTPNVCYGSLIDE